MSFFIINDIRLNLPMGWVPFQMLYLGSFSNVRCNIFDATLSCEIYDVSINNLLHFINIRIKDLLLRVIEDFTSYCVPLSLEQFHLK